MKIYDVVEEDVDEGWPIDLDTQEKLAFLGLGQHKDDPDVACYLHFDASIADHIFYGENPLNEEMIKEVRLTEGSIARDGDELCVVSPQGRDGMALVRVSLLPGLGGSVTYHLDKEVDVLTEGIIDMGGDPISVYVLVMPPKTSFVVERTGELRGASPRLSFIWDGTDLVRTKG